MIKKNHQLENSVESCEKSSVEMLYLLVINRYKRYKRFFHTRKLMAGTDGMCAFSKALLTNTLMAMKKKGLELIWTILTKQVIQAKGTTGWTGWR